MTGWIIVLYFIVTYSISFMFVYSNGPFHIFDKIRDFAYKLAHTLGELFDCMYCFPSWVGIVLSILNQFVFTTVAFTPFCILFPPTCPWYIVLVFNWFVTSGGVYLIDCIVKRILGEVPENGAEEE